jgi:hypothetical protein
MKLICRRHVSSCSGRGSRMPRFRSPITITRRLHRLQQLSLTSKINDNMSSSETADVNAEISSTNALETRSIRRGYHGSCHCGFIKYIIYSQFPPLAASDGTTRTADLKQPILRIRKCNCSTCHKMAYFHVRLPHASQDFALLSPLDPLKDLGDYTCFDGLIHWLFCKKCAVRCFSLCGEGEVVEKEIEGVNREVWVVKHDDRRLRNGDVSYLTINAQTLEPGQEGLDLREWYKKKWVCYLDCLDEEGEDRYGEPHRGGTY